MGSSHCRGLGVVPGKVQSVGWTSAGPTAIGPEPKHVMMPPPVSSVFVAVLFTAG